MNERAGVIRDIEILRAVAVIAVVCQHIPDQLLRRQSLAESWWGMLGGGWVGVDLFFAISGFVIARSLVPRMAAVTSFAQFRRLALSFWTARLFRLAPSAWLWLALILLACWCWNRSGIYADLTTNLWWTLSGLLNFSNYLFTEYFRVAKPGASFVYWSLSLEEQFYLLFPLLLWIFRRRIVWVLLLLAALQVFTQQRGIYGMMFRTDAIALGVLLALAHLRWGLASQVDRLPTWVVRVLVAAGVLAMLLLGGRPQAAVPMQVGLIACLSVLCVCLCSGQRDQLASGGACSRLLLWLGRRSYAIYLIHIPAFFFVRELLYRLEVVPENHRLDTLALGIGLLLFAAAANYHWIERPAREYGRRLAGRLERAPAIAGASGAAMRGSSLP